MASQGFCDGHYAPPEARGLVVQGVAVEPSVREGWPASRRHPRVQNAGPRHDPCPAVRPAGGFARGAGVSAQEIRPAGGFPRTSGHDESARCILQPDLSNPRSATPEPERRFQKIGCDEEAVSKQRPHACQEDRRGRAAVAPCWSGHGKPSVRSESVGAVLQAHRDRSTVGDALQTHKEGIYGSNKREPLGKAYVRGHQLPIRVSEPAFSFGQATNVPPHHLGQNGKDVIAPTDVVEESPATHEQYVRSHYAYDPGERIQRRYAWPKPVAEDPAFRFGRGASDARRQDSVGQTVFGGDAWGPDDEAATKIVQKNGEDFRRAVSDHLAKGRVGPAGRPQVPPGFAFGVKTNYGASAGEAIRGCYTTEEQLPDKDLGRCVKPGRRNFTPDSARAFGKASGLPRAHQRSASVSAPSRPTFQPPPRTNEEADNFANHAANVIFTSDGTTQSVTRRDKGGYDGGAAPAIAPGCFGTKETREDFSKGRCKEEVKTLLEAAGCNLAPTEFNQLWSVAARDGPNGNSASLESVVKLYAEKQIAAQHSAAFASRGNTAQLS